MIRPWKGKNRWRVRPAQDQFWKLNSDHVRFQYNIRYIHNLVGWVKKWLFQRYLRVCFSENQVTFPLVKHGEKANYKISRKYYRYHLVMSNSHWNGLPMQEMTDCDNF